MSIFETQNTKVNNYIGILSWKQSVKNTQQYMGRWYVIKY